MITRIELTNFMSHKQTVIEPAAGLTVLIGANNIGKSAVVAALQILCHNETSTHVIRHGERECAIRVETKDEDGQVHTIEWRRKKSGSPRYLIDGQQFDRLGRSGVPDELHKALRLSKADSGADADFDVHFGTQKAPIFLLASTPGNAAKFFASSSDASRLVEIQKRHKDKLADAVREKNRLEAESRQVNAELAELEPVVDVDHQLTALEVDYDQLRAAAAWLQAAEKHAADLQEKTEALAEQSLLAGAFAGLSAPPQLVPTEPLANLISALDAAQRNQLVAQWRAAGLETLPAPPAMHDADRLEALVESLATLSAIVARGAAEQSALASLAVPPQLADAETLARLIERLASCAASLATAHAENGALAPLVRPPEMADVSRLVACLETHRRLASQRDACQAQADAFAELSATPIAAPTAALEELISRHDSAKANVRALTQEQVVATAEWTAAANELRAAAANAHCDVCGAELDPDRLIARAADGLGGHDHD